MHSVIVGREDHARLTIPVGVHFSLLAAFYFTDNHVFALFSGLFWEKTVTLSVKSGF